MRTIINWKIFGILLAFSIFSIFAIFPYIMTIQGEVLRTIALPLPVIFILQLVQSSVLFSTAILLGLYIVKKVGFHLPVLEAFTEQKEWKASVRKISLLAIPLGCVTAMIIYFTDVVFTSQGAAISISQNIAPVWQKLLASFYGGITEEILMRLFLMSLFAWIGMKISRKSLPSSGIIILSILLSSIIFGLGHLPITASLTQLTPLIILRAVILNGIGGIVFGWLFWKKGLESAMIAHFTADIFLLSIFPMLLG